MSEQFNFQMDSEKVESGDRGATLTYPYLGWSSCIGASFEKRIYQEGKPNERTEQALELHFKLEGDLDREGGMTEPGTLYIHREKIVDDPTKRDKIQNQVNRVGYILKYLFNEDTAKKALSKVPAATTLDEWWLNFGKTISTIVKAGIASSNLTKKRIKAKCVGKVFTNDDGVLVGYVAFTPYLGFLGDASKALAFNKGELAENAAYMRYLSGGSGASNNGFNANAPGGSLPSGGGNMAIEGLDL